MPGFAMVDRGCPVYVPHAWLFSGLLALRYCCGP